MACFESAVPKEDYTLSVTMTNGNRLTVDMSPHLNTVQFCALKDLEVWRDVEVRETSLCWKGAPSAELSVDRLLSLWEAGGQVGQESSIAQATSEQGWQLHVLLQNGNRLQMDMRPLLSFPLFGPLSQKVLWKSLQAEEHSLRWGDARIRLELPLSSILQYFT